MAPSLLLNKMPMTPFRVMVVVAGVAAICLVFSALNAPEPNQKVGTIFQEDPKLLKRETSGRTMANAKFWHTVNLQAEKVPSDVKTLATSIEVSTNHVKIDDVNTFYREANPPEKVEKSGEVVVLLHGMKFKSQTWLELGTIKILAAMGHRVIAIDLPGYGETKNKLPHNADKGKYLKDFISGVNAGNPILVSPSMSGSFAFPYIVSAGELSGFVPVAPVNSEMISSVGPNLTIPTLIIYGENDHSLGTTSRDNLVVIPTSQAVMIPNGSHPAYLDNPEMFHQLLYNFISQIKAQKAVA